MKEANMILGKLAKTGALVASGILIGGLLSYNSEKNKNNKWDRLS